MTDPATTILAAPKQASRVIRTVHQAIITVLVTFLPFVAILDLPADKVLKASAVLVGVLGVTSRLYQRLFPAEPPLETYGVPEV